METTTVRQDSSPSGMSNTSTPRSPKILYIRDNPAVRLWDFAKEEWVYRKGNPIACLAYQVQGNTLRYGISTLNPLDGFNRPEGRNMAIERYQSEEQSRQLQFNGTPKSVREMLIALFTKLSRSKDHKEVPTRVKKSAKLYCKAYTLYNQEAQEKLPS